MISRFRPTLTKAIVPLLLVAASLIPDMLVRQGFFGMLSYPLSFIYRGAPFVYRDKPWYLTGAGAFVTALVWAIIVYVVICVLAPRRARSHAKA
jgi:uncharacterized membrane protein (GlpM family)